MKKRPPRTESTAAAKATPAGETCDSLDELAARLGMKSLFSLELLGAAGAPGLENFAPYCRTQAEVSQYFEVAPSTITTWRRRGMPTCDDETFNLAQISEWVLKQPHKPRPYSIAAERMKKNGIRASGALSRALLRWFPIVIARALDGVADGLREAFPTADPQQVEELAAKIEAAVDAKVRQYSLTARGIELIMTDLAFMV